MRFWLVLFLIPLSWTSSCVTSVKAQYGVQTDQLARNPARIAVLPCRIWPQEARFSGQPSTEAPQADIDALCQRFDQYVLQGFDGQPYMRGLSPKVVKALLEQNQQSALLSKFDEIWARPSLVCESCRHPASFYSEVLAPRIEWRTWLSTLSRQTSQADAILLPLIIYARQGELNDRGLIFNSRQAQLALLLIDTNNGQLIWIGGRSSEVRLPKVAGPESTLPNAEDLYKNIFVNDLWLEFPGRQVN